MRAGYGSRNEHVSLRKLREAFRDFLSLFKLNFCTIFLTTEQNTTPYFLYMPNVRWGKAFLAFKSLDAVSV